MDDLINNFIAMALGLLLHVAMKWAEARKRADEIGAPDLSALDYVRSVPAQTTVSVLASLSVFWVAHLMTWLNPGMSFACGYIGNSLAENLANRYRQPDSLP